MDCEMFEKMIQSYHDGELDTAGRIEYERHLSSCHRCRLADRQYKTVHELLSEMPTFEPSPGFDFVIMEHLRSSGYIGRKSRRLEENLDRVWHRIPSLARNISVVAASSIVFLAIFRPLFWILVRGIAFGLLQVKEALLFLRDYGARIMGYLEAWDVACSLRVAVETMLRVSREIFAEVHTFQVGFFLAFFIIIAAFVIGALGVIRRKGEDNVYAI